MLTKEETKYIVYGVIIVVLAYLLSSGTLSSLLYQFSYKPPRLKFYQFVGSCHCQSGCPDGVGENGKNVLWSNEVTLFDYKIKSRYYAKYEKGWKCKMEVHVYKDGKELKEDAEGKKIVNVFKPTHYGNVYKFDKFTVAFGQTYSGMTWYECKWAINYYWLNVKEYIKNITFTIPNHTKINDTLEGILTFEGEGKGFADIVFTVCTPTQFGTACKNYEYKEKPIKLGLNQYTVSIPVKRVTDEITVKPVVKVYAQASDLNLKGLNKQVPRYNCRNCRGRYGKYCYYKEVKPTDRIDLGSYEGKTYKIFVEPRTKIVEKIVEVEKVDTTSIAIAAIIAFLVGFAVAKV